MPTPERCNCGSEDCPRCYPLNRKQAEVTERDRADALTDIVDEVMDYGRFPRRGRAQVDLYEFVAEHLDTSFAFELVVAVLSSDKETVQTRISRLYDQVQEMLKKHYIDTDMVEELAQEIADASEE
jgi:hypothetical protein